MKIGSSSEYSPEYEEIQEISNESSDYSIANSFSTNSEEEACKGNCACPSKVINVITKDDQDNLLIEMENQIQDPYQQI